MDAKTALFFTQQADEHLSGRSKILTVMMSLSSAFTGLYSIYAGSKAPAEHITRAASKELGSRGISVDAAVSGPMETPFLYGQETKEFADYHQNAADPSKFTKNGLTDPHDIAPVVLSVTDGGTPSRPSRPTAATPLAEPTVQMSRFLLAGLAVIVALVGAGCSSGSPQGPPTPTSSAPTSTPGSGPTSTPGRSERSTTPTTTASPGLPAPATSVPMMPNPNGDGSVVPCEGTICTNPNHGGGDNPNGNAPPEPGQTNMQGPGTDDGPPEPGQMEMQPPPDGGPPEPDHDGMQG